MMFLSALNVGAPKVTLRRNRSLCWAGTGELPEIEGLGQTRDRKQTDRKLVSDDRKLFDDSTKIAERADSHLRTSFLFLLNVSSALCGTRRAATFSVLLREKAILQATPMSFVSLNGSKIWRRIDVLTRAVTPNQSRILRVCLIQSKAALQLSQNNRSSSTTSADIMCKKKLILADP
jgi:hypothetical protein